MNGIRFLTMLAGLLLTCAHVTNVAADNIQDKIKNTDQKILKEQKKIKEEQTKQRKAKQELIKTKKEINNLDQNLNRLSKRERSLLGELKALEKKERVLKSSIKEEKIRLSQLIKRTYILGYSPEAGPAIDTLSDSNVSAFYLKKIAMKRSEIIKNFNSKITEIDRLQEKKLGIRKELKKIKKDL